MDLSHLDKKYFLDFRSYNCPFCNRGSVTYEIIEKASFNWSGDRIVYLYLARCQEKDCRKISIHFSDHDFNHGAYTRFFENAPENFDEELYDPSQLDDYFFFHQPTSFFTIDSRINEKLRTLVSEAENSLKMNFLVGASACLRKTIYELIDLENARVFHKNGKTNYKESILTLKDEFSKVPKEYFDALAGVQELVSDNVHEGSWKSWDSSKLKILIELTKNILTEMYVVPEEQKGRAGIAGKLISQFKKEKSKSK